MPSAATRRQTLNSAWISSGSRTAVGSSRMSKRGSAIRHLTISTRWRSPIDRSSTLANGLERQLILRGEGTQSLGVLLALEDAALAAEHQIVDHGHRVDQAEMLVDHRDAGAERIARTGRRDAARR